MTNPDAMRASDRNRDAAIERLGHATVEGRLTLDELTVRIDAVHAAQTHGELAKVTADLPERGPSSTPAQPAGRQRTGAVPGDATRHGARRAEGTIMPVSVSVSVSVFGDVEVDLRDATVPAGDVDLKVVSPFGNIDVLVPHGVDVETSVFTLFGGKKIATHDSSRSISPPVIRIRAISLFGCTKIWRRP